MRGTAVTLTCTITKISGQGYVLWQKTGEADLANSVTGYTVDQGTVSTNKQVSTLVLTAAVNTEDTVYTCVVTAGGIGNNPQPTDIPLRVFGNLKLFYQK